jgi:general secretion pathway protein G
MIGRACRMGFTFLEIMLVVLIIGVLASIVATSFVGRALGARITSTQTSIAVTETALLAFEVDQGRLPSDLGELVEPPPLRGGVPIPFYLEVYPRDAWGELLIYHEPPEHLGRLCDLYSVGPNGVDERCEGEDVRAKRFESTDAEDL